MVEKLAISVPHNALLHAPQLLKYLLIQLHISLSDRVDLGLHISSLPAAIKYGGQSAWKAHASAQVCMLQTHIFYCCMQEQKTLIESMIAEDDKIEGLEHVECKVFK